MEFDSGEQFVALYFLYAYKSGFQFHVRTSDILDVYKEKGVRRNGAGDSEAQFHMMKRIRLVCSKGRKSKTDPKHVQCKVFVDDRIKFGGDKFVITQCDLVHNLEVDPSTSRYVSNYRHIGEYFLKKMLNDRAGIPMTRNFNTLVMEGGGYEYIPFNYRDAHELISYFDILKMENPKFYSAVQKDVNGALLNIFWADARCRAMYKAFGDPVSYDTTFLSNMYRMLFSPFVGVNHHGSTFTAIDRDMRTLVHENTTEEEFQNLWAEMVEKYNLQQNSLVRDAWSIRRRWVPVYWMDTFWAGMSSTQRSEQSNRYFKTFVIIETGLKQFIDQFEFALKRKTEKEKDQGILFEDVFHKVYTNKNFQEAKDEVYGCINTNVETFPNNLGFVKMFRATSKVNGPFWKKEQRCFDVSIDTVSDEYKYGCKLFEFKGIVCMHVIKCLDVLDVNSERVKRSVELTVISDYMTTLAMHDDEAYHIYMTKTNELIKTLEAHAGIENVDAFGEGDVSTRLGRPFVVFVAKPDAIELWFGRVDERCEVDDRYRPYKDGVVAQGVDLEASINLNHLNLMVSCGLSGKCGQGVELFLKLLNLVVVGHDIFSIGFGRG
ncbi:hypothetical protein RND81_11G157400 [Saponaria officinalis]|uniref:Protein FAR1-RELATED SEQUENCE n=1 Tax=Saponaria officinalis TaxID=3572 RepID=A0AAW1HME3_SAPOF